MCTEDPFDTLEKHLQRAYDLRRELHREPDLSGDEGRTREVMLAALPPGVHTNKTADTGAVRRIGREGPAIALRGELDALPVQDETRVEWASTRDGVTHACGHDVHLAALVAVAWTIAECEAHAPLLVVLQPREETYPSGALDIVTEGILEDEQCAMMIGAHLQPAVEAGWIACAPGGVNASADEFEIIVEGSPGHAAYPHLATDPIVAISAVVMALQSIVSRSVDPMASAVLGVSSLSSGSAANVVPGTARATGTIRAMSTTTRAILHRRLEEVSQDIARAHGCTARVSVTEGEPVLENDPQLVRTISGILAGRDIGVIDTLRSLGADDFSYYSERLPSAMLFVGSEAPEPLHSPRFLPTDQDLRMTARALLAGFLGAASLLEKARP